MIRPDGNGGWRDPEAGDLTMFMPDFRPPNGVNPGGGRNYDGMTGINKPVSVAGYAFPIWAVGAAAVIAVMFLKKVRF
jgi:hypothetical protein